MWLASGVPKVGAPLFTQLRAIQTFVNNNGGFNGGLSAAQRERFVVGLEAFLRGCAAEIAAKLADDVPDLDTCLAVRMDSFGCAFIELMTEYAAERPLDVWAQR